MKRKNKNKESEVLFKKNIPHRKCVGCKEMKPKKDLIRVCKGSDNNLDRDSRIKIDHTSKLEGRGAYICKDLQCLSIAQKKHGFERSFKCKINNDLYSLIEQEIKSIE